MNGQEQASGFRLLGHTDLAGHGNGCQIMLKDHFAFVAHMSGVSLTIVDVADPRDPRVVNQLPIAANTHSHKVQVVEDLMIVNAEQDGRRDAPFEAGARIYDVSRPTEPRELSFFSSGGRGVHRMWFVDGRYLHVAGGADGYSDQIYLIIDLSDPGRPTEVGRWWLPGMWGDGGESPCWRPGERFAAHGPIVAGDRAYLGWWDAGLAILDIAELSRPRLVARVDLSPPFGGTTHTALPLPSRDVVIVTDEALGDGWPEPPKLAWVIDVRDETRPIPIATLPVTPESPHDGNGRLGPHNLHENRPGSLVDETRIFATYFSGGVRVFDLSNPFRPEELAYYIPPTPPGQGAAMVNDLLVTPEGLVYVTDRFNGGLYILEYTGP